jgi:type I restriction enzyme S subunit
MKKVLLSIKPCYVAEILAGRKTVEYRKRIPQDDTVRQVLIYSSHPVKRVVAEFTLGGFLSGPSEWLWGQTSEIGGIAREVFAQYFEGKEIAYAYQIDNLQVFEHSRPLAEYGLERGPQDFCYVED